MHISERCVTAAAIFVNALFQAKTMLVDSIAALKTARFRSAVVCLALCGISAAALLLRLHQLEVKGLYGEAASWTFPRLDWEPFWRVMWK